MANVNDTYFEGYYKEIWRAVIPDELTIKELDFMVPYFNLQAGSKVLDLMCGYGRHALTLAKKGIEVTAVDNLPDYIEEIKRLAAEDSLPVKAVLSGVLDFNPPQKYDLALCMGNSLNFFNAADTQRLFTSISSSLNGGGHLLINTWSLAEIVFKNFKEKSWNTIAGFKFLTDSKILFQPTRMETESIIIDTDGVIESKTGIDYIFSINEIEAMLHSAGLHLKEVFSIPGRKKFAIGDPRAYIVAEKS